MKFETVMDGKEWGNDELSLPRSMAVGVPKSKIGGRGARFEEMMFVACPPVTVWPNKREKARKEDEKEMAVWPSPCLNNNNNRPERPEQLGWKEEAVRVLYHHDAVSRRSDSAGHIDTGNCLTSVD